MGDRSGWSGARAAILNLDFWKWCMFLKRSRNNTFDLVCTFYVYTKS